MKDRTPNDRDEFERLVRRARMQRAVFLGEAIAAAANAMRERVAMLLGHREERRPLAAG